MPRPPHKIPENIDFTAQEVLEAPGADRPAVLENIAKAADQAAAEGRAGNTSI
jgi:hypothetical protein